MFVSPAITFRAGNAAAIASFHSLHFVTAKRKKKTSVIVERIENETAIKKKQSELNKTSTCSCFVRRLLIIKKFICRFLIERKIQ